MLRGFVYMRYQLADWFGRLCVMCTGETLYVGSCAVVFGGSVFVASLACNFDAMHSAKRKESFRRRQTDTPFLFVPTEYL